LKIELEYTFGFTLRTLSILSTVMHKVTRPNRHKAESNRDANSHLIDLDMEADRTYLRITLQFI